MGVVPVATLTFSPLRSTVSCPAPAPLISQYLAQKKGERQPLTSKGHTTAHKGTRRAMHTQARGTRQGRGARSATSTGQRRVEGPQRRHSNTRVSVHWLGSHWPRGRHCSRCQGACACKVQCHVLCPGAGRNRHGKCNGAGDPLGAVRECAESRRRRRTAPERCVASARHCC